MLKTVLFSALSAELTFAYSSSIEDCEKFAALWNGNCGGTDEDAVYTEADWETSGAGATVSSCSTGTDENGDDIEVREPNSGTLVTSYSVFGRNCITCSQATDNDPVYIRY